MVPHFSRSRSVHSPPFDAKNHLSLAVKINAGKFARIPDRYSDDLYRAIRWMLSIEVPPSESLNCETGERVLT